MKTIEKKENKDPKAEFKKSEYIFFERIDNFHVYLNCLISLNNFKEGNIENVDIDVIQIFENFKNKKEIFIKDTEIKNIKGYLNNLCNIIANINSKLKNIQNEIDLLSKDYSNNILPYISQLKYKKDKKLFSTSFEIPEVKNIETLNDLNFNIIDNEKAKNLFVPIINRENSILQCCFKSLNFEFGPFCPTFYKDPIKITLRSRLNEKIYAKILSKDFDEEKFELIENKGFMSSKKFIYR